MNAIQIPNPVQVPSRCTVIPETGQQSAITPAGSDRRPFFGEQTRGSANLYEISQSFPQDMIKWQFLGKPRWPATLCSESTTECQHN